MPAQLEKTIAEMYEEDKNLEEAIEHFQRAADYFIGEVRGSRRWGPAPARSRTDAVSPWPTFSRVTGRGVRGEQLPHQDRPL